MKWKSALGVITTSFLILASSACSAIPLGIQSTLPPPPGLLSPTPPGVTEPPPEPAPTNTPQPAGVLPAPLYFLSAADQQIWRIEPDGKTLTQITHETVPVIVFDVSPADGQLAYVSNNDLIVSDPHGGNPRTLVTGGPFDPSDIEGSYAKAVGHPHWLPDGAHIAYNLNGVNLVAASGGQPRVIAQNDPVTSAGGGQLFLDGIWSPDGQQVLLYWGIRASDAFGFRLKALAAGTTTDVTSVYCCSPSWTPDGRSVYLSSATMGIVSAGLWRVDAQTGAVDTLFDSNQNPAGTTTFPLFSHAQQLGDGRLYFFYADGQVDPNTGGVPEGTALRLARSDPDGVTNRTQLRSDAYKINEVLWAPDGRGAAIAQTSDAGSGNGPLLWLDAANNPAVPLPAQGYQLHWAASADP